MERIAGWLVLAVLVMLLNGCGLVGSSTEEERVEGYLLRGADKETEEIMGILFVQYVPDESLGDGRITGRMHHATVDFGAEPPGVVLDTAPIQGTIEGDHILIQEESPAQPGDPQEVYYIDYQGTIEGDNMELTRNVQGEIVTWEGEAATLEDFGAAAEELTTVGRE